MLTTAEAGARVMAAMATLDAEPVDLANASGRILRQAVIAERDQPPFDRVMMDGIAIAHVDFRQGRRAFPVQATQAAGDPALTLDGGSAIEIMTGASLPQGADCIIPVERITIRDGIATLEDGYEAQARQFIHARASDHAAGTTLLRPGMRISPPDIAIIAAAGLADVQVSRQPVIRILSTGNELVPAGQPIAAHQVRLSNGPALGALLGQHGYYACEHEHLPDDAEYMRERIATHLAEADTLILSGGVSMGKADFVPGVLAELGVEVVFHKIRQRPGKPMWFGKGPAEQTVFALPGNPVSALVCGRQYVIPALARASQATAPPPTFASLASNVSFEPDLTCLQPVRLVSSAAGQLIAMPVKTNTSGDFTALSGTDGYVELPREKSRFPAGTAVLLHRW